MINFDKGLKIARIEGGKYSNKQLYIYDKDIKCCSSCSDNCTEKKKCCFDCGKLKNKEVTKIDNDDLDLFNDQYFKNKKKKLSIQEMNKLRNSLKYKDYIYDDDNLRSVYDETKKDYNIKNDAEFSIIDDGRVIPLPTSDDLEADHVYVSGPSGSGKSTWVNMYIREILKMFPNKDVFVFSTFKEDDSLDKNVNLKRIEINEELINNPIQKEELNNSICIFDDIDTIPRYAKAVQDLRNDLLENGRKEKIRVICTSHLLMNYKYTRTCLNSCQKIVFFPKATSAYHIKRFLHQYCGFNIKSYDYINKLPSRWIMIYKSHPQYLLHEKGCILLNKLDDLIKLKYKDKYTGKNKK